MAKPIGEQFLGRGDIFALRFNEGIIPLSVQSWEFVQYEPHTQMDSIPAQDSSGTTRLEDGDGDDILFIEKDSNVVYHIGIGQRPSSLRRYTEYPENGPTLGAFNNLSSVSSRGGDNYGHADGSDSPYEQPTDARELFIPPGIHMGFDFYNPNQNENVDPILNIRGRKYSIDFIDPSSGEGLNTVKRILSPGSPMPIADVGSMDNRKSIKTTGWDVKPIDPSKVGKSNEGGR